MKNYRCNIKSDIPAPLGAMFAPSLPPRMVVRRLLSYHATRLAQLHLRHAYCVIAKIKLT